MPESMVYILGAGCSYPLGLEMKGYLEKFDRSLDPETSPRGEGGWQHVLQGAICNRLLKTLL